MGARVLLLVALLPSIAFAQEPPRPPTAPAVDEKSPAIALALSAGVTAGGIGMMAGSAQNDNVGLAVSGFFVFLAGPSTGHWYAGSIGNGGTMLRLAGLGLFILGVTQLDLMSVGGDDDGAAGPLIAGTVMYGVGSVYEIITAPRAAHEYNREQRRYALTPLVTPNGGGLALGGTF